MSKVEYPAVVLVAVASPHAASLIEELLLDLLVPVLVLSVEPQVLPIRHVVHSEDPVVPLHGQVLHGGDWGWDHLLQVMHLVDVLGLVPEPVRTIDEDQVLVLVVDHLGDVVEVDVL